MVIGTTGQTGEDEGDDKAPEQDMPCGQKGQLFQRYQGAVSQIAPEVSTLLPGSDIAIEEIHHNKKKDAPSGNRLRHCATYCMCRIHRR